MAVGLAALFALAGAAGARAEVFYARDEALKMAFAEGVAIESRTVILADQQVEAVRQRTGLAVESRLFTFYTGRRAGAVVGYAVIDTHVVRTLPETFLAVLTPSGAVERVVMLAFHEPREYLPPPDWLDQFNGRGLDGRGWRLGHDVHGISGATLTARAVDDGLRRIMVMYDVVIRDRPAP